MAGVHCRHFNGYKPCGKVDSLTSSCSNDCAFFEVSTKRILLIHLGALGAVVRSTALLPAIHRKYPGAHLTWITDAPADVLLREHPLVDRVLTVSNDGAIALAALDFDVALVIDKSLKASGLLRMAHAREVFGYVANPATGGIEPANESARASWELGLSDHLKFNVNRKAETELMHEALELGPYNRDRYHLVLNEIEKNEVLRRRSLWSAGGVRSIVGVNTGCAPTIAYKKLSIEGHVEFLEEIVLKARDQNRRVSIVLLGGKEDSERNKEIANRSRAIGISVVESPTDLGLRDGMMSVASCDVIVSGDSLGLHMALGFHKPVVAWFGPTCLHEIDLFGGVAFQTAAPCAPCWKRSCEKPVMCYDRVDLAGMADTALKLITPEARDRLEITPEI